MNLLEVANFSAAIEFFFGIVAFAIVNRIALHLLTRALPDSTFNSLFLIALLQ